MDKDSIFIQQHLGLIIDIAWKKFKNWMIYEEDHKKEELIHEGMLGLLRARDKFNDSLGFEFSTYATSWIWGKMSRYIKNQSKLQNEESTLFLKKKKIILERSKEERDFLDNIYIESDEKTVDLINFINNLDNTNKKRYRDICILILKGYTQTEIASFMGTSQANIQQKLGRIRKIIREEYLLIGGKNE